MPSNDYKTIPPNKNHYCYQEARITAIETKLQNKKENLHEVHEDYYHLRDKLETISENVVELTTLMRENKKKEEANDKRIASLQLELKELKTSWQNLKWIIGLGVPIMTTILTIIANYLL